MNEYKKLYCDAEFALVVLICTTKLLHFYKAKWQMFELNANKEE